MAALKIYWKFEEYLALGKFPFGYHITRIWKCIFTRDKLFMNTEDHKKL